MQRVRRGLPSAVGVRCSEQMLSLVQSVRIQSLADLLAVGIHEELTRIIDTLGEVCGAIHGDYFAPTLEVIRAGCPLFVEKPFVFDLGEA
jgi:hypothetical protein